MKQDNFSQSCYNMHLHRAKKEVQLAVDTLANQVRTIAEEEGPIAQINSRFSNLTFDIFKVKGVSKKRRHPNES